MLAVDQRRPAPTTWLSREISTMSDAGSKNADGRIHLRAPIELKVEYKKLNTFFSDYTKNISKGGTFIKTERPLKVGTEFVFKLFVPARGEPFTLRGSVGGEPYERVVPIHAPTTSTQGLL